MLSQFRLALFIYKSIRAFGFVPHRFSVFVRILLRELKAAALRVRYREAFGEERQFLFRQARAEGDHHGITDCFSSVAPTERWDDLRAVAL